ncbi:MAG: heme o synthase [Acidimicrobiales bacterium]|nr:heme o synthase [Acidimicrobiales bacterium]
MTDVSATPHAPSRPGTGRVRPRALAFVALTKPRIVELLLVTTIPTMIVAEDGLPSVWLMIATFVGGALSAGGANAYNMYVDRDIDALMERTKGRPLVTGEVSPREALVFATAIEVAAFVLLATTVNLLSAVLALSACLFYVIVYTIWLKRTSKQNIVIGGAAGAVPVLVGWAAIDNSLPAEAWLLFFLMFMWTPPHFWALAIKYAEDYRSADVPMLPAVASAKSTAVQMIVYTVPVVVSGVAFGPLAGLGPIYAVAAVAAGAVFMWHTVRLLSDLSARRAMKVFGYSITYVTVVFAAMAVDVLVRGGL